MAVNTGVRYQGSKRKLVNWILTKIPSSDCFVDACGGGGSVTLAASMGDKWKSIIYNDINNDVVNFFKQARDNIDELARVIAMTPHARSDFFDMVNNEVKDNDLERARRYFVIQYQSFRALGQNRYEWEVSKITNKAKEWKKYPQQIKDLSFALQNIAFDNRDIFDIIKLYNDEKVTFYVDPPYVPDTLKASSAYKYDMLQEDHEKLSEVLHQSKSNVAISGYPSDLYNSLYADWEKYEKSHYTSLSSGKENIKRIECLWIKNPCEQQSDLFD